MALALAVSTYQSKAVSSFSTIALASYIFTFWQPSSSNFSLNTFTFIFKVRKASLY